MDATRRSSVDFSEYSFLASHSRKTLIQRCLACFLIIAILGAVIFLIVTLVAPALVPPTVSIEPGRVEGSRLMRLNKVVQVFQGIPFAAPPLGDLRLRKPVMPNPWNGTLSATRPKPMCMQYIPYQWRTKDSKKRDQSEDCLYLNVYVPGTKVGKAIEGAKKTVMVWIHGGAFVMGSATNYDPSTLAAFGDVIVVTLNYRLGLLGFMKSYHNDQMPGNLGLFDQVMAFDWIYSNIEAFGGDRDQVTLFGESAGGISVGFHMISYKSRNLFNRAILQSGSPLTAVMMVGQESGPLKVEKVAKFLECPYTARKNGDKYAVFTDATYECIRKADVTKLIEIQDKIIENKRDMGFYPIEDNDFFPDHPYDSLKNSNFGDQKSIIIGNNANEGATFLTFGFPDLFPRNKELPPNLTPEVLAEKLKQFMPLKNKVEKLKVAMDFMFGGDNTNGTRVAAKMDKLLSQAMFICPNVMMVDSFVRLPNRTAYYYQFNPRPSTTKHSTWSKGAMHHEEVQFVFGYPVNSPEKYTREEVLLSKQIMDDWSTFAKTGSPAPARLWSPCTKNNRYHLMYDIKTNVLKEGMPENKCEGYFQTLYEEAKATYAYNDYKKKKK